MAKKQETSSGMPTPFKDQNGEVIKVHDYVKDSEGNRYYINSSCQAVPDGDEGPAIELTRLVEKTQLHIMSIEEVLNIEKHVETKRRGGRRKKGATEKPAEYTQKPADEQSREGVDQNDASGEHHDLSPATMQMVVSVIPDDVLANELRRRGYTLCAVRPALIEL